ncbi:MAG: tyrosine-type recombinase/integrase [Granulosicoccus sp.]
MSGTVVMASIRARQNASGVVSYTAEIRLRGFPPQSATFKRKTDAKQWVAATESAIRENRYFKTAEAKKHTLAEMIDRYVAEILPTKPKAVSQAHQLKWFKKAIGGYLLCDITTSTLVQCRNQLASGVGAKHKKRLRSPATVNRYLAALSHAYTIAVNDWEWVDESPMRRVKKLTEPRGRVRFLSDDIEEEGEVVLGERSRLLLECSVAKSDHLLAIVVLALSTGMRLNEIRYLTWSVVDLQRGRITLYETKNGDVRVLPLLGRALELLSEQKRLLKPLSTDLVFPSASDSAKPVDVTKAWRNALARAEICDFKFHDLRHSAASYLAMSGATPSEISEVLGHKTLQMVKRYSHLSDAHTATVIGRMNARIFS